MMGILLAVALTWALLGTVDHFLMRRAVKAAYELGVDDGVRQVSSW